MKKLRVSLMALALTIGVGASFATSLKHHQKKLDNLNWQTTNPDGSIKTIANGGSYESNVSEEQAADDLECPGGSSHCAVAVTSQDGAPSTSPATYIFREE